MDLANEDRIRSDVRANWPAETARELRSSTSDVLDLSVRSYPGPGHLAHDLRDTDAADGCRHGIVGRAGLIHHVELWVPDLGPILDRPGNHRRVADLPVILGSEGAGRVARNTCVGVIHGRSDRDVRAGQRGYPLSPTGRELSHAAGTLGQFLCNRSPRGNKSLKYGP